MWLSGVCDIRKEWENSSKIKHAYFITAHSLTDYFDKTVSMILFFNLCHYNDCQSHSNRATPLNHSLSVTNFKNPN